MANKWKIIAIIFIILFALETAYLLWGVISYNKDIEREKECIIDICDFDITTGISNAYDSYYYDTISRICYCYKDYEIVKQKYMK